MDKLFAIKIKYQNGTYSESIPIGVMAEGVEWDNTYNLKDIIGYNINVNNQVPIPLQTQINEKVNLTDLQNYMENTLEDTAEEWLNLNFNEEDMLKKDHLKTTVAASNASAQASNIQNRQYPVVFDSQNKLSVNVPWIDTIFNPKTNNFWTGTCSRTIQGVATIILDNSENFSPLVQGKTIAVYFRSSGAGINQVFINGSTYPIYIPAKRVQINDPYVIKIENATQGYFNKNVTLGYQFLTYISFPDEPGFLLTSANTNVTAIYDLESRMAESNSPNLTGIPTAPTADPATNNTQIATTAFVQNKVSNVLRNTDLKTTTQSTYPSSNPSDIEGRQYPVVFDSQGKLSVNVPEDSSGGSNIQKIWTGNSPTAIDVAAKIVSLDNPTDFQLVTGTTIMIRTFGNTAEVPTLKIDNGGENQNVTKPIRYYYNGGVVSGQSLYSKWGRGLKTFTYNANSGGYWIFSGTDQQSIYQLENTKANIHSPAFTGQPTAQTVASSTNNDILATTAFVQNVTDLKKNAFKTALENGTESINFNSFRSKNSIFIKDAYPDDPDNLIYKDGVPINAGEFHAVYAKLANSSDPIKYRLKNLSRDISLQISSSGSAGLWDEKNQKWIIGSSLNNSTYIGGLTISNDGNIDFYNNYTNKVNFTPAPPYVKIYRNNSYQLGPYILLNMVIQLFANKSNQDILFQIDNVSTYSTQDIQLIKMGNSSTPAKIYTGVVSPGVPAYVRVNGQDLEGANTTNGIFYIIIGTIWGKSN